MKIRFLLTLALSSLLTTSVFAKEAAAPCPCPLAFAGFSFGGTVGYGIGNANINNTTNSVISGNNPPMLVSGDGLYPYAAKSKIGFSGIDGGLIAGYLHRFGNWGLGADFLANWTSANSTGSTFSLGPYFDGTTTETDSINMKLKNSLQVRSVFSYVLSNLIMPKIMLGWDNSAYRLAYQTGYIGSEPSTNQFFSNATSTVGSKRLNGLLWGVGIDFLMAQNTIFGLEYTGVQSQKVTFRSSVNTTIPAGGGGGNVSNSSAISLRPQYNTFKATLKYIPGFPTYAVRKESPAITSCPSSTAFQGFSLGGTLGYGIGQAKVNNATTSIITGNTGPPGQAGSGDGQYPYNTTYKAGLSGVDGGLIAGYLNRFGNWGIGADFLANWTSVSASRNILHAGPYFSGTVAETDAVSIKLKNSLQLRGVFSYVLSNLIMPKIMLGWDNSAYSLAYLTDYNASDPVPPSSLFDSQTFTTGSKRLNGLLWGVGVDFLVAKKVVFGLEYTGVQSQKVTFRSSANNAISAINGGGNIFNTTPISLRPQYNTFKAVLKYVF